MAEGLANDFAARLACRQGVIYFDNLRIGVQDGPATATALATVIYQRFYMTGGEVPDLVPGPVQSSEFLSGLVAACAVETSRVAVKSAPDAKETLPGDPWRGDETVRVNGVLAGRGKAEWADEDHLRLPSIRPMASPGFLAFTGAEPPVNPLDLRIYLNLKAAHASDAIAAVTTRLSGVGIPFHFKVLKVESAYSRCDAGVLYMNQSDYRDHAGPISEMFAALLARRSALVPTWSNPIAPGIGCVIGLFGRESFGTSLSKALADQVIKHLGEGPLRRNILAEQIEALPVIRDQAALDIPALPVQHQRRNAVSQSTPKSGFHDRAASYLMETARYGTTGVTWLESYSDLETGAVTRTLDTTLYGGLPGIAWFLQAYGEATRQPEALELARKAIRTALALSGDGPGLFDGQGGIYLTAFHCMDGAERDAVMADAEAWLNELNVHDVDSFDYISGLAGLIRICLTLALRTGRAVFMNHAERFGAGLVRRMRWCGEEGDWPGRDRRRRGLVGLSHGTSGSLLALRSLALHRPSSSLDAAIAAAGRYEERHYSATRAAWPDLRPGQSGFARYWCHGRAGIALCHEPTQDVAQALVADLADTRPKINAMNLCHGYTGLAVAALSVGAESEENQLRGQVAAQIDAMTVDPVTFRPGLMLGITGIAWARLWLEHPQINNPLVI